MDLQGKAAIVTGGGTGVGRATALALAGRGCAVVVNYSRSAREAEQTAAEAGALGVRAIAVQADVADDAACRRLVDEAVRAFGRLDVLVNNAGATVFVPHAELERIAPDDWNRVLGVNLIDPFQLARAARAPMEASGGGAIVNVSSVAGIAGIGSSIPYCASKAAVPVSRSAADGSAIISDNPKKVFDQKSCTLDGKPATGRTAPSRSESAKLSRRSRNSSSKLDPPPEDALTWDSSCHRAELRR